MFRLLVPVIVCLVATPAVAQWPTTDWVVMEKEAHHPYQIDLPGLEPKQFGEYEVVPRPPVGERKAYALKHEKMLEAASMWYQLMGFGPPKQWTDDMDLEVESGESYLAFLKSDTDDISSSHGTDGQMLLSTNAGFVDVATPMWKLMEPSAVHELYHGIQQAYPALVQYQKKEVPGPRQRCNYDKSGVLDWLIEGTAAAVQIRWIEHQKGVRYGHPFKGSKRAAWVRYFDQSLHWGSLPPGKHGSIKATRISGEPPPSWYCSYGTWYFWYALGELLGRTPAEKVAYTRFIYEQTNAWDDYGYANVDAGLKAAAKAYDAIKPYRGGLYDLYPQFVAQFLTEDRFFEHLHEVDLETPDLYQTTSQETGGKLGILASRAWRFRIPMPRNASVDPYLVRFTLDVPDGVDRGKLDALHLIVGPEVAPERVNPAAPYVLVKHTDSATRTENGSVEFLVRVANAAKDVDDALPTRFLLRVEVGGFYGEPVDQATETSGAIAAELPPGFVVRGPGAWNCSGDADARAVFDLVTPDEAGRDIERAVPQIAQGLNNMMDDAAIALQKMDRQGVLQAMEQQGIETNGLLEKVRAARKMAKEKMESALAARSADSKVAAAADKARAQKRSGIAATFVGKHGGEACQMIVHAGLKGREGGAQIVAGAVDGDAPIFKVGVYSADMLDFMRNPASIVSGFGAGFDPSSMAKLKKTVPTNRWKICAMTGRERQLARAEAEETGCPLVVCTAGRMTLEDASQGHIAGSFTFEVVRWTDDDDSWCPVLEGRDTVTGHFNVTSTDRGHDDNSIGGVGFGFSGPIVIPGGPLLNFGAAD